MGYNKRHITTHGIFSAYKNGGFKGVSKYFSIDAITGVNKDKFTGDIYDLMIRHMHKEVEATEIIEKIKYDMDRHEFLVRQSQELSREYINQSDTAQQSWALESIEKIDKEIGYYV